jgi:hypothetical protein
VAVTRLNVSFWCDGCEKRVLMPLPYGRSEPTTDADFDRIKVEFIAAHDVELHLDALLGGAA